MRIFKTGFMGASLDDVTVWCYERSEGAKSICVPFAGSGKDIASMAQRNPGAEITSWDPQFLSHAVVNGIFAGDGKSNLWEDDVIRARKGVMFEERPLKNMSDQVAGYFDWVAKNGTLFDKAALTSATVRSTMVGRMTHWDEACDVYSFRHKIELAQKRLGEWVGLDAKFNHTLGSFFDNVPNKSFDLVQIDPPKVVGSRDVYSKGGFAGMNKALGGPDITEWKKDQVIDRFKQVLEIDAERFLFLYVSEVKPDILTVKRLIEQYGTIEEEKEFGHGKRYDIAWLMRKDK